MTPPTQTTSATQDERLHRPFRNWALQYDPLASFGGQLGWAGFQSGEFPAAASPDNLGTPQGQAFLRRRLRPKNDAARRTWAGLALWGAALTILLVQTGGPSGLKISSGIYWFLVAAVVVIVIALVIEASLPRKSMRRPALIERTSAAIGVVLIAYGASVTGGATSPFTAFLIFSSFYSGYFMDRRSVQGLTALCTLAALAPLVYDADVTEDNGLICVIALVVVLWTLSATVFYRREISRGVEKAVTFLALADPPTGVANLRSLEEFFEILAGKEGAQFAIVMADMNGLKGANTVFGYDAGDGMLLRLAQLMQSASGKDAQVARIGGDEFAVLLPRADQAAVDQWCETFNGSVEAHNEAVRNRLPQISVSIGSARFPEDGRTLSEVVDAADRRMYAQKNPAVPQPYELPGGMPESAGRILRAAELVELPPESVAASERFSYAALIWMVNAFLVFCWLILPGSEIPHPTETILLGAVYTALAFAVLGLRNTSSAGLFASINDALFLIVILPGLLVAGGWESPLQMALFLTIAFLAQYSKGRAAAIKVGAALVLYTIAIWTTGPVDDSAQTLFVTIVVAGIAIAAILQFNARTTAVDLAVIREAATRDPMTGFPNLHAFRSRLTELVHAAAQGGDSVLRAPALVIADVDDFRHVNTAIGHLGGDEILRLSIRRFSDAAGSVCDVFRIGGDEFAAVFEVERPEQAAELAEKCRAGLAFNSPADLGPVQGVTASVGSAVWSAELSADRMVHMAQVDIGDQKVKRDDGTATGYGTML